MKTFLEHCSVPEVNEAFKLDNVNHVHHDSNSLEFAKHYVAGNRGDYRPSNPTPEDDKHAEHLFNTYHVKHLRTGFGGSGTSVYTHKQTGQSYEVNRTANGRTFYGTDHNIRKLSGVNEEVALDEAKGIGPYSAHEFKIHVHDAENKSTTKVKEETEASTKPDFKIIKKLHDDAEAASRRTVGIHWKKCLPDHLEAQKKHRLVAKQPGIPNEVRDYHMRRAYEHGEFIGNN